MYVPFIFLSLFLIFILVDVEEYNKKEKRLKVIFFLPFIDLLGYTFMEKVMSTFFKATLKMQFCNYFFVLLYITDYNTYILLYILLIY